MKEDLKLELEHETVGSAPRAPRPRRTTPPPRNEPETETDRSTG